MRIYEHNNFTAKESKSALSKTNIILYHSIKQLRNMYVHEIVFFTVTYFELL